MGFPRQEYWSRLPFVSPGDLPNPGVEPRSLALQADALPLNHQGVKWSEVKVAQLCPPLCDPMDYIVHGILQARILGKYRESGWPFPSPGDFPNLGILPMSPTVQADSVPAEPPGKPCKQNKTRTNKKLSSTPHSFPGQRILEGYSSWGREESDVPERQEGLSIAWKQASQAAVLPVSPQDPHILCLRFAADSFSSSSF